MPSAARKELYKKWLVNEERNILIKIDKVVDQNEVINQNQVQMWRDELKIPAMFRKVAHLEAKDLQDVEEKI